MDGADGMFTTEDVEMFNTYATYAAVSLRNCNLYADLQREKEKNETLVQTLELLCGTPLQESHKVQSSVMKAAQRLLKCEACILWDADGKKYVFVLRPGRTCGWGWGGGGAGEEQR